ncbi:hypothetical protein ACWGOQ_0007190 [Aquimarina sp. M1]
MNLSNTKSEKEYITIYQDKGYTANFIFKDGKLFNSESKNEYNPKQVHVVAEHRFEGASNPNDMSILYVVKMEDNSKGIVLAGYGPSGNLELADFFKSIPEEQHSNAANIDLDS